MSNLKNTSRQYLYLRRSKWLIFVIGFIILIIRAFQFIFIGSAGTIALFIGSEWAWIILYSELIASLLALIGCFALLIKENFSNKKYFKTIVIGISIIALTLHFIRWIPYLLVFFF